MSNIFRSNLVIKMDGKSHSQTMHISIMGFPKGIKVNKDDINHDLCKRRPNMLISNARIESDDYEFLSGIKDSYTTGEELIIVVKNNNYHSDNYNYGTIRPGHADYPAYIKYGKDYDYRGGGQFSGRLTVLITILGSLCKEALKEKGVRIASHIEQIGNVYDKSLLYNEEEIDYLHDHLTIDPTSLEKMDEVIKKAKEEGDSLGGIIEAYATGVKVGLGEDYFGGLEAKIASLIYSIPGVKGLQFGSFFDVANKKGSDYNDQMEYIDGKVNFLSNNAGGINGGLANGNPIYLHVVFRPTASIRKEQKSIIIDKKDNIKLQINGNHDACFAYRCGIIVEGMMAIALLDSYLDATN